MNALLAERTETWEQTTLGGLVGDRAKSINPGKSPRDQFELYSVPSFPGQLPETVRGHEIGSSKQLVEPRSVLLCKINPRINRAWVVGDFTANKKIASTEWIVFPPNRDVVPEFLCYFLQRNEVRDFLAHNASGVGGSLMRVKSSTLRDFPFAYPRPAQQQQIVDEIEKEFTRLDAGVAALRRVQANLKRYRAAVLKAACEGRLVPTEAELAKAESRKFETGEELLERALAERRQNWRGRRNYQEPINRLTHLSPLPSGWAWANIEQVSSWLPNSIQSGPFGSHLLHSEFQDAGILAIGIDNVRDGSFSNGSDHRISEKKYEQLKKFQARPGDVVVTVMATIGRVCVLPPDLERSIITKHCYRITAADLIDPTFLSIALRADSPTRWHLFGNVRGQTRPGLNGSILKAAPIPIPPRAEQVRIVAEVDRRMSVIEELEAAVSANLRRATRLRQAILARAFAG